MLPALPVGKDFPDFLREVERRFGRDIRVRRGVLGSDITTFALGGPLGALIEPIDVNVLPELFRVLNDNERVVFVIGNGSNLLIHDSGVNSIVLRLGRSLSGWLLTGDSHFDPAEALRQLKEESLLHEVEPAHIGQPLLSLLIYAGTPLIGLSRAVCAAGFSGLEFAAGIPGSVGGAVKMNAGAHGRSISDNITAVYCINSCGECVRFLPEDLCFSYRSSGIEDSMLVFAVQMRFERADAEKIVQQRNSYLEYRKRTQPLHMPSAGSVFRNPFPSAPYLLSCASVADERALPSKIQFPAGKLIESAGLKGFQIGGAGFSEMHANWIVKLDSCTRSSDVQQLIQLARERVMDQFSIELQTELTIWRG
jgi:UDP-N-acetylmuramate dehydrogenase